MSDLQTNLSRVRTLLQDYTGSPLPHFVNGVRDVGTSGRTFESILPVDNSVIGEICCGGG